MTTPIHNNSPIKSEFAGDPDMRELVEFFVDQMPERVRALQQSLDAGALEDVRSIAHQLKGAGGSYGFPQITDSARLLEEQADTADIEAIRQGVDQLISICNRAAA